MPISFEVTITKKDSIDVHEWVQPFLAKAIGKDMRITVERKKKRRSTNENNYYWDCVIEPIMYQFLELGNSVNKEDVHNYLVSEVGKLEKIIMLPNGEFKRLPGHTSTLSTEKFEEYLEKCRAFAAEMFGILIPLPNEELERYG
jgi:hypothetical protein